ncbi:hypothetical protein DFS34DRAFT_589770 [Phlyctochytrium arcticum]|nr:hypothetical protein DFS34DRAFT_589770 [Phlyctochytrium arcticum]
MQYSWSSPRPAIALPTYSQDSKYTKRTSNAKMRNRYCLMFALCIIFYLVYIAIPPAKSSFQFDRLEGKGRVDATQAQQSLKEPVEVVRQPNGGVKIIPEAAKIPKNLVVVDEKPVGKVAPPAAAKDTTPSESKSEEKQDVGGTHSSGKHSANQEDLVAQTEEKTAGSLAITGPLDALMTKMTNETQKAELGRAAWRLLHTMVGKFPEMPHEDEKRDLLNFIYLFGRLYPCGDCARHFKTVLENHPPDVSSGQNASMWACKVHNVVNERLKKPIFDCEKVGELWKCGCSEEEEAAKAAAAAAGKQAPTTGNNSTETAPASKLGEVVRPKGIKQANDLIMEVPMVEGEVDSAKSPDKAAVPGSIGSPPARDDPPVAHKALDGSDEAKLQLLEDKHDRPLGEHDVPDTSNISHKQDKPVVIESRFVHESPSFFHTPASRLHCKESGLTRETRCPASSSEGVGA